MIGVLVVSHGSRSAEWVRLVDDSIAPLRRTVPYPIVGAFLELVEGRLIQDGIDELERLGVRDIIVVPLFVSSGSTHVEEIAWALGAKPVCRCGTDLAPFRVNARVRMCEPIGADGDAADILYEKMRPLSRHPAGELVLVVGHGSELSGFHGVWRQTLDEAAARLRALGGFAAADGAMLLPDEADRKMKLWRGRRPELAAIVVPFFVSEGYFTEKVIPARFAGYDVRYNGRSLLPHPSLTRWIERRIAGQAKGLAEDGQESETHL